MSNRQGNYMSEVQMQLLPNRTRMHLIHISSQFLAIVIAFVDIKSVITKSVQL